ncbi:MAG: iron chelate uptake ABC transporter family permease subunit [Candidatus Altarchaeum sp.]|nr:iron chelate uptake ABC transporter family permease subunit [Candidatus Altarchaeum sp.]
MKNNKKKTNHNTTTQKKRKYYISLVLLILALFAAIIFSIMLGPVEIHPFTTIGIFLNKIGLIDSNWTQTTETIVTDIRVPRVLVAALVGAGLAIAGAAMQGLFKNPMAEPYVLGMSSGAAVGVTLVIVLGISVGTFGVLSIQIMAFFGALGTILVVYGVARSNGKIPVETLLLAGIAIGAFLYAVVSFMKFIAPDAALRNIVLWLMGSFSMSQWDDLYIVTPLILIGIVGLYAFSRELNAMQFGEETAMYLGVKVETVKKIILVFAALITATGVSHAGIIGFVGLIIPHAVRILIGADHHILLPASALMGAIFLILADTLARTIASPAEIPIGIITAFVGTPYFIYLLRRKKKTTSWW